MNLETKYTAFGHIEFHEDGSKKVYNMEKWGENPTIKTQEKIDSFFRTEKNPALGILTGKINDLTVIDFDTKDNDLMMTLYEIAPTRVIMTRKGFHLYYRYIDDPILAQGTVRFQGGVDVRNDGGIIFAPPTPNYIVSNDVEIATLTPEALEAIRPYAITHKKISNLKTTTTRNDDLFRMACAWINEYPKEEVFKRMVKANKEFMKGELSMEELETIYQQAIKYEPAKVEAKKLDEIEIRHISDIAEEQAREMSMEKIPTGFQLLDDAFQGGLRAGNAMIIAALAGEGKTAFMQTLSYHYSLRGITSLWFSYEETMAEIWERFKLMGVDKESQLFAPWNLEDSKIDFIEKAIIKQKQKTPFFIVFIDQLFNLYPKIDGKAKIDHLSSNHSLYLGQMSTQLKDIAMKHKIIVITAHQLNKAGDLSYSDMVRHAPDKVLYLKREEAPGGSADQFTDKTFLKVNKNRPLGTRPIMPMSVVGGKFVQYGSNEYVEEAARKLGGRILNQFDGF